MNLEQRLRAELERSSRSTRVDDAPAVAQLASIANQRRARNRLVGSTGALALTGTLLFAAFAATDSTDSTVVAAQDPTGPVEEQVVADTSDDGLTSASSIESENGQDAAANAGLSEESLTVDGPPLDETSALDEPIGELERRNTSPLQSALQGDAGALSVSTRDSAVEFAGGSGVLLVADGSEYLGLATKFESDGAVAIGLSSINGLDWAETELSGVPQGATATVVREHAEGYVALFTHYDIDAQARRTFVGNSTDMTTWVLSDPLPGQNAVAVDLAVGPDGVLVIGDGTGTDFWFGPLDGPFETTGQLDAAALYGVTTLDGSFLVAGRSPELGIAVFSTNDGVSWNIQQLSSPDLEASSQSVALVDGTIVLTSVTDGTPSTLISNDGGTTWEQLDTGEVRSISISGSALGFLGGSQGDATVTVSDGESFATAQLDVAVPDRLTLLSTTSDTAVMLSQTDGGELTWIVASR